MKKKDIIRVLSEVFDTRTSTFDIVRNLKIGEFTVKAFPRTGIVYDAAGKEVGGITIEHSFYGCAAYVYGGNNYNCLRKLRESAYRHFHEFAR